MQKVNLCTPSSNFNPFNVTESNKFADTPIFGSSISSTKFSFTSPSSSQATVTLPDNGLSFASLAKSTETASEAASASMDSPFKIDSNLSFASLAQSTTSSFTPATHDSRHGFFGLSNENAFSNFQKTANESKDDSTADDTNYDPHYDPIIPLPDEIVVRTGEEDEEKLFGERAKLYRYDATNKEWKERGNYGKW